MRCSGFFCCSEALLWRSGAFFQRSTGFTVTSGNYHIVPVLFVKQYAYYLYFSVLMDLFPITTWNEMQPA
jgi:hypothetical protein